MVMYWGCSFKAANFVEPLIIRVRIILLINVVDLCAKQLRTICLVRKYSKAILLGWKTLIWFSDRLSGLRRKISILLKMLQSRKQFFPGFKEFWESVPISAGRIGKRVSIQTFQGIDLFTKLANWKSGFLDFITDVLSQVQMTDAQLWYIVLVVRRQAKWVSISNQEQTYPTVSKLGNLRRARRSTQPMRNRRLMWKRSSAS